MPESDYREAVKALGYEPKRPVGVVLSLDIYRLLLASGVRRFPCSVAVSNKLPRGTERWIWLRENFAPWEPLCVHRQSEAITNSPVDL